MSGRWLPFKVVECAGIVQVEKHQVLARDSCASNPKSQFLEQTIGTTVLFSFVFFLPVVLQVATFHSCISHCRRCLNRQQCAAKSANEACEQGRALLLWLPPFLFPSLSSFLPLFHTFAVFDFLCDSESKTQRFGKQLAWISKMSDCQTVEAFGTSQPHAEATGTSDKLDPKLQLPTACKPF